MTFFISVVVSLVISLTTAGAVYGKDCPAITANKISPSQKGNYPQQYELERFEKIFSCKLSLKENPRIKVLNRQIRGNSNLPPLNARLPQEPLVVAPYEAIGNYGGTLQVLSKATEAGTADLLSIRHVNLTRYSDDLTTIVPNIAKSWEWNKNFTVLTMKLRKGHKWSDGHPFGAEDIAFWYNDLIANKSIYSKGIPDRFKIDGKPMKVEALNSLTIRFTLAAPKPGLLSLFATDYAQPFQPKHFLGKFHPNINPNYKKEIAKYGFKKWADAVNFFYGGSDWKDVPSPLLKDPQKIKTLPRDVVPTLESHILIRENSKGRYAIANPYFHMVDTKGQQLPYIEGINELHVPEKEIQNLKIVNGEVTYKAQSVFIEDLPVLQANESKGNYTVDLTPSIGEMPVYSFNINHPNKLKLSVFSDLRFRQAASLAINREEMNALIYYRQGQPAQYTAIDMGTVNYITEKQKNFFTKYDPKKSRQLLDDMGLVDKDGDGFRDFKNGSQLVILLNFANQGAPVRAHELFAQYMGNIGIKVRLREVTSDEYRADQSNNKLDIMSWKAGFPAAFLAGSRHPFIPPFGDFFGIRNGLEWSKYLQTGGSEGIKPPKWVYDMDKLSIAYQRQQMGSKKWAELGQQLVDLVQKDLLFIGTIASSKEPLIYSKKLGNFKTLKAQSFYYHWAYSFRPNQWYLKK